MKQISGKRVNELRKNLGLKQVEFAEKLGLTSAAISAIELDKAPLTEANIRLICFTFKVNEEWLREGKGEMLDEEAMLSEWEKRLLELFRKLSPGSQKDFIEYVEKLVALATNEAGLRGGSPEAPKQAPEGVTQPLEALQEAKGQKVTDDGKGANPIHDKKRG
jgi:transcriptional regulator with XRE-family HTH domain